jgi:hypothetical protein
LLGPVLFNERPALAGSSLDHEHLSRVEHVGMDIVKCLDLGHRGIVTFGDKPKRVTSSHPVFYGSPFLKRGLPAGINYLAPERDLQPLACSRYFKAIPERVSPKRTRCTT